MTPDVTVIIPTYNSAAFIAETLDTVFSQSIGTDRIELLVVDDGSTDGTAELLDAIAAEHECMTVRHQPNSGGPASPRNHALDCATGRYIFFLDADDLMNTECLERMVRCADEQGSDVVLGRLTGGGGRRPPTAMFTSTQLKTNAFESRVWWALNVLKLFRRDFIEEHGLRFREDIFSEDQPFTGTAYLRARTISVLADYDYVTFVWRDDHGNMTLSDLPLGRYTDALKVMLDLIVENVEAGPDRDHLLRRHFEVEYFKIFIAMANSTDEDSVDRTFELLRTWALEHYPAQKLRVLPPPHRVAHHLLVEDRRDELVSFVRRYADDPSRSVSVDGDRVSARPVDALRGIEGVPDSCFEVTDLIKIRYILNHAEWAAGAFHLEGAAILDLFAPAETEMEVVLRRRDSDEEYILPVERIASPGYSTRLWRKEQSYEDAGFRVAIDPLRAAAGHRLPDGIWDPLLRLSARGITRESRFGRNRSAGIDSALTWRYIPGEGSSGLIVASYFTASYDNLSLDVGSTRRAGVPWAATTQTRWTPGRRGVLEVIGVSNVDGLDLAATSKVVVRDEAGREVTAETTYDGDGFTARIDPRQIRRAGLARGKWSLTLHIVAGDSRGEIALKSYAELGAKWVWLGGWPHRVRASGTGAALALQVSPLSASLIARGLRRGKQGS